jgi:hypothetical protein
MLSRLTKVSTIRKFRSKHSYEDASLIFSFLFPFDANSDHFSPFSSVLLCFIYLGKMALPFKKPMMMAAPLSRTFATTPAGGDVVVPECVDTLEWVIESPPNIHQFDEPPLIVEIEHLKNMQFEEI